MSGIAHAELMDSVRFGLSVRALRHRRGWTQAELAHHAGLSQSAISRIERGAGDALTVRLLSRVAGVMGARIRMQVLWQGEELDRLLDAAHARLVERVIGLLGGAGWLVAPEVTYRFGAERGSIDVLASIRGRGTCWSSRSRVSCRTWAGCSPGSIARDAWRSRLRASAAGMRPGCRGSSC